MEQNSSTTITCFSSIQFDFTKKPKLLVECWQDSCVDFEGTSLWNQQKIYSILNLIQTLFKSVKMTLSKVEVIYHNMNEFMYICICNLPICFDHFYISLWQIYGATIYFHFTQKLVCSILLNTCDPAREKKLKQFFRNKFPGLLQDSDWFFQHLKIHINPFTLKIAKLILLTVCHTLIYIFYFRTFKDH